ncbi:OsmC family peroxiredoxin [Marmoricola sp. RAF53]|uniref:OsmC family peroxiredoxin n=1 Tax=Marmoricola sp. RAF53 TaxID=3233059 RepID=UPI003F9EAA12
MTDRKASTVWTGTLFEGSGETSFESSGIGTYPVSWPSRAEEANGKTSPEELIAGAHSACYSMAFSNALAKNETPAEKLEVSAVVTFVPGTGITRSALTVVGTVPGIDAAKFAELAQAAKEGCPVSQALSVEITLDASLA